MLKKSNVFIASDMLPSPCLTCLGGKITKLPFQHTTNKSLIPFEVVHSDVWGPAPCLSIERFNFCVTFIDECTRFCWIFPIINKAAICGTFMKFYQS